MVNLLKILSVPVLVLAAAISMVGVATVSAQETCDDVVITNTGPGSNNEVTCAGDYKITIECVNDTRIVIDVNQNAESGTATVSENTTGGNAQTGDAVNLNNIDAFIENNNCYGDEEPEEPETPVVPETPVTPVTTEPEPVVASAAVVAETLPETGETSGTEIALYALVSTAAAAVATKAGIAVYSRR